MSEEKKQTVEEIQQQVAKETIEFIRTKINKEESKDILCALITINKVTGQLLINTTNAPLMADTKMMLQESLDMLNRQQIITALIGRMLIEKGGKNDSPIIHR
jgi:hypothetical protein